MRFAQEIELARDILGKFFDETHEVVSPPRGNMLLEGARYVEENRDIFLDYLRDFGPLHLDDEARSVVRARTVDLLNRGRGERQLIEARKKLIYRAAQLLLHDALRMLAGEGRHRLLQLLQLAHDLIREKVALHA